MSLGGENLAGFLRGFGGLLQLGDGTPEGVEILGARSMPSASIASFRAAMITPESREFGERISAVVQPAINALLIILGVIGIVAFAAIFGPDILRQVQSMMR